LPQRGQTPGTLALNPNLGIGETIDERVLVWSASTPDEYRDLLLYLSIT